MVKRASVIAALLVAACTPPWSPATVVEDLRVLAVKASPPEVKPGQPAQIEALLLDPSRPGEKSSTLWFGCAPDPFNLGRGPCSQTTALGDPSALFGSGSLPEGVSIIGFNDRAAYGAPKGLFDVLSADDPVRQSGTVGQVIGLSVAEDVPITSTPEQLRDVFARVQDKSLKSLLTIFRVRVSENAAPNRNPEIDWFGVDGQPHPVGGTVTVKPAQKVSLRIGATPESFETYQQASPSTGELQDKVEQVVVAWYSSFGRFEPDRLSLTSDVPEVFTAPGDPETPEDPVPQNRNGTIWAVARDSRGGVGWASFPLLVCDVSLPAPVVTGISLRGAELTARGEQLSSLLELVVGNVAVPGGYSPSRNEWVGQLPALVPAGTWPVTVIGRECSRAEAGQLVTVVR